MQKRKKKKVHKEYQEQPQRKMGDIGRAKVFHVAHLINYSFHSIFSFHLQKEGRTASAQSRFAGGLARREAQKSDFSDALI